MKAASYVILRGGSLSPNAPQLAVGLFTLKLGKKIVHTNFQDALKAFQFDLGPQGDRETGEDQIPGRGDIDFPQIIRSLRDVGYDKTIIVQVTCNLPILIPGQIPYPLSRQMGIAAEARGYLSRCLQELKHNSKSGSYSA